MTPETVLLASYIFSWQFPHFYGILYENKSDYKKAGFVMLSNEDEKGERAFKQIAACSLLNTSIPVIMSYIGMLSPYALIPFMGY